MYLTSNMNYQNLLSTIYPYFTHKDAREKFALINSECLQVHRRLYPVTMSQFMQLVLEGQVDTVDWILNENTNFRIINEEDKQEALYKACISGSEEMVKLLLEHNILPTDSSAAFTIACSRGNVPIVRSLLNYGLNPGFPDSTPLVLACSHGHLAIVWLLLNSGMVDPTYMNNYSLRLAVSNRRPNTVMLLLQDPRVDPRIGLEVAIQQNNYAMINLLQLYI